MNAETWTDRDDLARRIDAVEALVARWKDAEERKSREAGVRIAIAIASSVWTFVIFAAVWALS